MTAHADGFPALKLHNTMSGKTEVFQPLTPNKVGLYVCGPTVYDRAHVGNARPVVVFDVLARLLRRRYEQVTYVRNITDVDDKINARASHTGEPIEVITARTTAWYHEDMAALGALPPDVEPRATHHIPEMIAMVARLVEKGHAYVVDGNVLFRVSSMPAYGRLSGRFLDDMMAGARVEVASYKDDPADFVLWKPSGDDLPGWDSPWGRGRPGWHIECSAMSRKYLGETFDIHGGGHDLIFPHHENEIAQSTCCYGPGTFAQTWLHNGHVTVDGEKMSKSLGNFLTVQDLLGAAPGEAIRLALLETHYRQPLDWTREKLDRAKKTLDRFYAALERVAHVPADMTCMDTINSFSVLDMLYDDLNTPGALSGVHQMISALNKADFEADIACLKGGIMMAGGLMGLLQGDPMGWRHGRTHLADGMMDDKAINTLIEERNAARKGKNFARADEIRRQLATDGIELEDGPAGTSWRRTG